MQDLGFRVTWVFPKNGHTFFDGIFGQATYIKDGTPNGEKIGLISIAICEI